MIKLIYGPKGSGKTKRIITAANNEITTAKGNHVYITDNLMHSLDVDRRIRFISTEEYRVSGSADVFTGFIKGLIAGDGDITKIYIDGLSRLLGPAGSLTDFFKELERITADYKIIITLALSCDILPDYLKRYV